MKQRPDRYGFAAIGNHSHGLPPALPPACAGKEEHTPMALQAVTHYDRCFDQRFDNRSIMLQLEILIQKSHLAPS